MFGLMRRASRLPYCGTCKTLGALYGPQTRLLLNHDTVFLAEMLLSIAPEPNWAGAYRSFNCLSMPKEERIPDALAFAATATVVLAHFKFADHFSDSKRWRWRAAVRLFSPSFRAALKRLRAWEFPVDELEEILATQGLREASGESLAVAAEPTAHATALFFSHGARVVGRSEESERMRRVGHRFGFLIYTLDAWEDRAKDRRSGDFNPLLVHADVNGRAEILAALRDLEGGLASGFALRLRENVEERLGMRPRVLRDKCRAGAGERWRAALQFARAMRSGSVRVCGKARLYSPARRGLRS